MRESARRVSDGSSVYTYGEGDLASRRLELVAEVMERSSRFFLTRLSAFARISRSTWRAVSATPRA